MPVGADVGGSRIKLVRWQEGTIVHKHSVERKSEWLDQLGTELAALVDADEAVGVGIAGLVDHSTGTLRWAPHLSGVGVPVAKVLSERIGTDVEVDNDANCAALAEVLGWAADPVLVVMVGTGIGAGLWSGGAIYRGQAHAGEVGHMTIEPGGGLCRCGRSGCWETRLSGWRLAELGGGRQVVEEMGEWLGRGLLNLSTILDPELIIVGGGVMVEHGNELLRAARDQMVRYGGVHRRLPRIVQGKHGIWAGAIGAAVLARSH